MDQLDKFKKQWRRQEKDFPQLSYDEIYKMILKKSSSIVKWIFLISIGEILFWTGLSLLSPHSGYEFIREIGIFKGVVISNIIYYTIFIAFIVLFFRNYKKISSTDSVKELMANILRTRKTVRYFIIYNVSWMVLVLLVLNFTYYNNIDLLLEIMKRNSGEEIASDTQFLYTFFIIQFIFGLVLIGSMLLFYRIIYGIFLRRLHRNYKELAKMEA